MKTPNGDAFVAGLKKVENYAREQYDDGGVEDMRAIAIELHRLGSIAALVGATFAEVADLVVELLEPDEAVREEDSKRTIDDLTEKLERAEARVDDYRRTFGAIP